MRIIVTTCQAFAATSLPPLLASLKAAGVELSDVIAYWDGPQAVDYGITLRNTDLKCFEMSGPLAHCWDTVNPFLAIHDTSIVAPEFGRLAYRSFIQFLESRAKVGGSLDTYMHCCMGFFDPYFMRINSAAIEEELDGQGKMAAVKFEVEARLLQLAGGHYKGMNWGIRDGLRHVDIYGTGNPRWERHFPGLGLFKYTLSNTIEGVSEVPVI
jgi:hypothetical protein